MNAATASSEKSLTAVKDDMEYIRALLFTMYYEQSEHLHSDFSEAYIKVSAVCILTVCFVQSKFSTMLPLCSFAMLSVNG